jgi:GDP-L-fucose synthase
MEQNDKIMVAGYKGLVGSAIVRALHQKGYQNLVLCDRAEIDLTNQAQVDSFFSFTKPDYVFLAAAKVGGIQANNTYRGEFIYNNLAIQTNVINSAKMYNIKRLLFLGSSCIYPRDCQQPICEEYLLSGTLEKTNEPYAVAKIAGIKMCEAYNAQYGTNFTAVMPTNLYGPNDNFDLQTSHVLPALIRKIHEAKEANAKEAIIWGTGNPKREFLHVDDLAAACLFIMNCATNPNLINIGSGMEVTIKELAEIIAQVIGFTGQLSFDTSKPDGTPRKFLNSNKLKELGWRPTIPLPDGIASTYAWFRKSSHSN